MERIKEDTGELLILLMIDSDIRVTQITTSLIDWFRFKDRTKDNTNATSSR